MNMVPHLLISVACCLWFGHSLQQDRLYKDPPYGSAIMLFLSLIGLLGNLWRLLHG